MKLALQQWELTGAYSGFWEFGHSMELNMKLKGFMPWVPASVPGSVHWDLYQAGMLPDPYYDKNSLACEWVSERDWLYRTEITYDKSWDGRKIRLLCEGIDYAAKIRLNGQPIGEHSGMFSSYAVDLTGKLLTEESNAVLIGVQKSPEGIGQLGYTNEVDHLKSRFGYKWDFGPRLIHTGLWKPVHLWITGSSWLEDVHVQPIVQPHSGQADVQIEVTLGSDKSGDVTVTYMLYSPDGSVCAEQTTAITSRPGIQKTKATIPVEQPELWWPNGYGEQPLYRLEVEVNKQEPGSSDRQHADSRSIAFGLRQFEFHQNAGAPDDSIAYTIVVNGRSIYMKGWNWGPVDQLYGRDLTERYVHMIALARKANINILRINGVGPMESELFYQLCDEAGILIWQEMPQSSSGFNNEPSADPAYLYKLQSEMLHVIKLKRNHASLVIWCGGNELTEGGHLQDRMRPLSERHPNLAAMRDFTAVHDPDRLYLPTSPTGPVFFLEDVKGVPDTLHDVHGPWKHGGIEAQYTLYNQSDALLHSEYGSDGYAPLKSMRKFLKQEDIAVNRSDSTAWLLHGYEYWNIDDQLTQFFGKLTDMEERVFWAQWLQAEGIRYGVESNRRRAPRCSGSLLWQLNEPYPNICCTSSVDYYGETKLSYSWVARANRNVHVSLAYNKLAFMAGDRLVGSIYLTADAELAAVPVISWIIRDQAGTVLHTDEAVWTAAIGLSNQIHELDWLIEQQTGSFYVSIFAHAQQDGRLLASNSYSFAVMADEANGGAPLLQAFRGLPSVTVEWRLMETDRGTTIELANKGEAVAFCVRIEGESMDQSQPSVRPTTEDGLLIFPGEQIYVAVEHRLADLSWHISGGNVLSKQLQS